MRKPETKPKNLLEFKTRVAVAAVEYKVKAYLFKLGLSRRKDGKPVRIKTNKDSKD